MKRGFYYPKVDG
jgi:glycerol-3-phosphate O-acyltransferase